MCKVATIVVPKSLHFVIRFGRHMYTGSTCFYFLLSSIIAYLYLKQVMLLKIHIFLKVNIGGTFFFLCYFIFYFQGSGVLLK